MAPKNCLHLIKFEPWTLETCNEEQINISDKENSIMENYMGLGLAERYELSSSTFQIVLILMFVILQDVVGKKSTRNAMMKVLPPNINYSECIV